MNLLKLGTDPQVKDHLLASRETLVSRLIGMETEYASICFGNKFHSRPSAKEVYRSLVAVIRSDQPSAPGISDSDQFFLANGAAISFESQSTLQGGQSGFIEFATPEVTSPTDLVACQRGIDQMLESAANRCDLETDLRLLKNSSDAKGNLYGCQENYEADVAQGGWRWLYYFFVMTLWVTQVLCSMASAPIMGLLIFTTLFRSWWTTRSWVPDEEGGVLIQGMPSWFVNPIVYLVQWTHLPLAILVRFIGRHIAFRNQRRFLASLLISRVSLCGSGDLDSMGRFRMSAKAMATNCLADLGSYQGDRPVFVYGHWFGQICGKSLDSWWKTRRLFGRRQRLQIGLSDSNMSELAEYVKVGSTSLILDMIEAGNTERLPRLKQPMIALSQIARDWNLVTRVPTSIGDLTAVEIQTAFWNAANDFVMNTPANRRGESLKVLASWKVLIDAAKNFRRDITDTTSAIGKLDWLTKHWLMGRQKATSDWDQQKKIDLRYHELSPDGYYRQLCGGFIDRQLVSDEQRERRRLFAPSNSPASRRGWVIREFSGEHQSVQVGWTYAEIGTGRHRKRVHFGNQAY